MCSSCVRQESPLVWLGGTPDTKRLLHVRVAWWHPVAAPFVLVRVRVFRMLAGVLECDRQQDLTQQQQQGMLTRSFGYSQMVDGSREAGMQL